MKQREKQILFVMFLMIIVVQAFADTIPVYVNPQAKNKSFNYRFNFTSDESCNTVLFSNKTKLKIIIDKYGVGAVNVGITGLKSPPLYMCEYKSGELRKAHPVQSLLTENLFIRTNFYVGSGTYNASRLLKTANSTTINYTVNTLKTNNATANKGIAALRTSNASILPYLPVANFSNVTTYNASGTYTWTKPVSKGADTVLIELWGAGGSGGCGGDNDAGGGGGGGGYVSVTLPLSELGATETCVVGAGGAGTGGPVDVNGQAGGNTSFGNIVAYGGGGGLGVTTNGAGGGGGGDIVGVGLMGAGLVGGNCGGVTGGCIGIYGGIGGAGSSLGDGSAGGNSIFGGAGGGGGGTQAGGAGGNSTYGGGGGGGGGGTSGPSVGGISKYGGYGGAGNTDGTAATAGKIPGGGGGGSESRDMGAGGNGQCRITVW